MKLKASFSALLVACALLALPHSASARPAQRLKQVKVYFYTEEQPEFIDIGPVMRLVRADAPARGAIEALLRGPTPAEESKGYGALLGASEFRIVSLWIRRGTARVEFRSNPTWHGWPGDIVPARFQKAVELTLKQFPNVRRVQVYVDGETNLHEGD